MIYFPATLTPVPFYPGYFWDVQSHKLYSLKVGGVLREMKMHCVHPIMLRRGYWGGRLSVGDKYYRLSKEGHRRTMLLNELKRLQLVHYDMPVINRVEEEEPA